MPAVGVGRLGNIGKIGFKAIWRSCQKGQKEPLALRGIFESVESVVGYTIGYIQVTP
jgi:hypothetical protein